MSTHRLEPLPWGVVEPLGGRPDFDPTALPGALPFWEYALEENELHFVVKVRKPRPECTPRFFIAEQPDAVHVVIAPLPEPFVERDYGFGWAGASPVLTFRGMLGQPLAERPVIDECRGGRARKVTRFSRILPDDD